MEEVVPSPSAQQDKKKAWKTAILAVLPDPKTASSVLRALESAFRSRLDPDMLGVTFEAASLDDETLTKLKRLYEQRLKQPAM